MSKFDNSCSNSTKQNQAEVMTDIWPSFMYLQMPPVFKTGTKRGITGVLGETGQSLCQNIQISNLYDSWRTPFKVCTLAGRYRCKWLAGRAPGKYDCKEQLPLWALCLVPSSSASGTLLGSRLEPKPELPSAFWPSASGILWIQAQLTTKLGSLCTAGSGHCYTGLLLTCDI